MNNPTSQNKKPRKQQSSTRQHRIFFLIFLRQRSRSRPWQSKRPPSALYKHARGYISWSEQLTPTRWSAIIDLVAGFFSSFFFLHTGICVCARICPTRLAGYGEREWEWYAWSDVASAVRARKNRWAVWCLYVLRSDFCLSLGCVDSFGVTNWRWRFFLLFVHYNGGKFLRDLRSSGNSRGNPNDVELSFEDCYDAETVRPVRTGILWKMQGSYMVDYKVIFILISRLNIIIEFANHIKHKEIKQFVHIIIMEIYWYFPFHLWFSWISFNFNRA